MTPKKTAEPTVHLLDITINKLVLLAAVQQVLPFIEKKTTIPILSNLLLSATTDELEITATNLDNSLRLTIPDVLLHPSGKVTGVKVNDTGSITLPGKKLFQVLEKLKTIDSENVTIKVSESYWTTVSCGPLTVKLVGMSAAAFPSIKFQPESATPVYPVAAKVMAGLIRRTSYAIASDEGRYTLNGAEFAIGHGKVRMTCTDGHRIATAEHEGEFQGAGVNLLIARGTLDLLSGLLKSEPGDVVFAYPKAESDAYDYLFFTGRDWTMTARVLKGKFPDWGRCVPTDGRVRVTVSAKQLKESLTRIASFADERSQCVRWQVGAEGLRLKASNTETGEASELIPLEVSDGVEARIGFSAEYVLEILTAALAESKEATVTLAIRDGMSAGLWTPSEVNGFQTQAVVMPMRL